MSKQQFPETVDAFGKLPNGELKLVGQVPIPERMKAKEFIAQYFGREFDDVDSNASMCLYAFDEFLEWQKKQNEALLAQKEGK